MPILRTQRLQVADDLDGPAAQVEAPLVGQRHGHELQKLHRRLGSGLGGRGMAGLDLSLRCHGPILDRDVCWRWRLDVVVRGDRRVLALLPGLDFGNESAGQVALSCGLERHQQQA